MSKRLSVDNYAELLSKLGDKPVWASAYTYASTKESRLNYQKPIRGRIMRGETIAKHLIREKENLRANSRYYSDYFVPFKKNSEELAWSKAVHVYTREYSETEEESIKLFNEMIQENIDWHLKEIEKLKKELIKQKENE